MTKRILTPLQKQLLSVKDIKLALREGTAGDAAYILHGHLWRVWDEIVRDAIVADFTDNQCRDFLYLALHDPNTPPKDRKKVEKILNLR